MILEQVVIKNKDLKRCCTCKKFKSKTRFDKNITSVDGFNRRCKECRAEHFKKVDVKKDNKVILSPRGKIYSSRPSAIRERRLREEDPNVSKERQRNWKNNNPKKISEYNHKYHSSERGKLQKQKYTKPYASRRAELLKERRLRLIMYLGGKCMHCGFSDMRALQIDHINNDGNIDRRNGYKGDIYTLSRRILNDPERYQLLCANCNWIKKAVYDAQKWELLKLKESI